MFGLQDPMNIVYYVEIDYIFMSYVIFDLACSLLLVETLVKWKHVTARGGIYAR
jgi:hypothetical protein